MEPEVRQPQSLRERSSQLLGLPDLRFWDNDELLGLGGIKPKSSPSPSRRGSASSSSEDDSQPPPSSSRRVSFADAFGLSLVSVKQFDSWVTCDQTDPLEGDLNDAREFFLNLDFALPQTTEDLLRRVREQRLELQSLELLPGTTTLKGVVRVLNVCFEKLVYIRTSLDRWRSHFDLLAEYVSGSTIQDTDCFSFRLTLVPPFGDRGARVDFCLRYDTPLGSFWANNGGKNYVLTCHEKAKTQDESDNKHKPKSCLKSNSLDSSSRSASNPEEDPEIPYNAVSEAAGIKKGKRRDDSVKLQKENSQNRNRRSRRKAARMAKIQQHFSQREDVDLLQMEKDTDEMNVCEHTPALKEAPLNPCDAVSSSPTEPNKPEGQRCIVGSVDTESKQLPVEQSQPTKTSESPAIHPELESLKSQDQPFDESMMIPNSGDLCVPRNLETSQDKETFNGQTFSAMKRLHESGTADRFISNSVDRAWESFEKGAAGRKISTTNLNTIGGKGNCGGDTFGGNNPDNKTGDGNFVFAPIVAPLYHQVFERLERERRELKNMVHRAGESEGKAQNEDVKEVTYRSRPRTKSEESRPNPRVSQKQLYRATCEEPSHRSLLKPNDSNDSKLSNVTKGRLNIPNPASETRQGGAITETTLITNQLKHPPSAVSWEESTLDQAAELAEIILQNDHLSLCGSDSKDPVSPPDTSHLIPTPEDNLNSVSAQAELQSTKTELEPSIDNQISAETLPRIEMIKEKEWEGSTLIHEGGSNSSVECLEESHIPIPEALFHSDISVNVTPNISQSGAPNLSQTSNQMQSLAITSCKSEAAGGTFAQSHITATTNMIQESESGADFTHVGIKQTETHSGKPHKTEFSQTHSDGNMTQEDDSNDKEGNAGRISLNPPPARIEGKKVVSDAMTSDGVLYLSLRSSAEKEDDVEVDTKQTEEPTDLQQGQLEKRTDTDEQSREEVKEDGGKEQEKDQQDEEQNTKYKPGNATVTELQYEGDKETKKTECRDEQDKEKDLLQDDESIQSGRGINRQELKEQENMRPRNMDELRPDEEACDVGSREKANDVEDQEQRNTKEAVHEESSINEEKNWKTDTSQAANDETICDDEERKSSDGAKETCCQVSSESTALTAERVHTLLENIDDGASTESLSDDELELYLHSLRHRSGLIDVSAGQRSSISRTRTTSLLMPSISEYIDEDHVNVHHDEQTVEEAEVELVRSAQMDEEEAVSGPNALWWKELSSDYMSKMFAYACLLLVFVVTTYFCDFVACFGLYLLAVYCLYFQKQREPLESIR